MNKFIPYIVASLLLPVLFAASGSAQNPAPARQSAYQSAVSQERLMEATLRLHGELARLVDEFSGVSPAQAEATLLRDSIAKLEQLTGKEMPEAVKELMEAAHSENDTVLGANLVSASGRQQNIQLEFRKLADQLARHASEAAMRKRLGDLAVRQASNLKATRARSSQAADNTPESDATLQRLTAEQKAIGAEIDLAIRALEDLGQAPEINTAPITDARIAAETARPGKHASHAAEHLRASPSDSAASQEKTLQGLQQMIAALEAGASPEDIHRELAAELANLAYREQNLANRTPRLGEWDAPQAGREQQDLATELDILRERISRNSPESSAAASAAAERSQELAGHMAKEGFVSDSASVAETADGQRSLAGELSALSDAMQRKADELSGMDFHSAYQMSPEETAVRDAMQHLQQTLSDIEIARRQNRENLDYAPRLAQAENSLELAREKISGLAPGLTEDALGQITQAEKLLRTAATGRQVEHELFHSRTPVNNALRSLQDLASQLAMQQNGDMGEEGTENGSGDGGMGLGGGKSGRGSPGRSALSDASEARREAISALSSEKVAPGYETRVDHYLKSLTTDEPAH